VRVVTLSPAQALKPCQQSRGVAALSMTHSHWSGGVGIIPHRRNRALYHPETCERSRALPPPRSFATLRM